MLFDMEYDGQHLSWTDVGKFNATSGLTGFQTPTQQCTPDAGPIPEGFYKLQLTNEGVARDDGTGRHRDQACVHTATRRVLSARLHQRLQSRMH